MTGHPEKERNALNRLADALAEDILAASDEDILAEFRDTHGDPDRNAAALHDLFGRCILVSNKKRLAAAKAGVAASRQSVRASTIGSNDIQSARARLRALANMPNLPQRITLAARKESELSDSDVQGMLEDLQELGLFSPEVSSEKP